MGISLYQGLCVRFWPCQFYYVIYYDIYYVIYYVIGLFYTDIYTDILAMQTSRCLCDRRSIISTYAQVSVL